MGKVVLLSVFTVSLRYLLKERPDRSAVDVARHLRHRLLSGRPIGVLAFVASMGLVISSPATCQSKTGRQPGRSDVDEPVTWLAHVVDRGSGMLRIKTFGDKRIRKARPTDDPHRLVPAGAGRRQGAIYPLRRPAKYDAKGTP